MNALLKQTWTTEQFLDWENRQELRCEFDGFRAIAIAGGTAPHSVFSAI